MKAVVLWRADAAGVSRDERKVLREIQTVSR
jgi:hypothetical protein